MNYIITHSLPLKKAYELVSTAYAEEYKEMEAFSLPETKLRHDLNLLIALISTGITPEELYDHPDYPLDYLSKENIEDILELYADVLIYIPDGKKARIELLNPSSGLTYIELS